MTDVSSVMRIYLDDERKAPPGWKLVRTARECLALLKTGKVAELSLDHDLVEEHYTTDWTKVVKTDEPTGYDVVLWIEEQAFYGNWDVVPRKIGCHSMNTSGGPRIVAAIRSIQRFARLAGVPEVELLPRVYHKSEDEAAWQAIGVLPRRWEEK